MVELLISSNISRYAEFRCVNRILTWQSDKLETVPCSRADVFATKNVGLIEKRQLMQLLTLCVEYKPESGEFKGFEDKTLKQYLESKNLTENLMHYVLYAIAMSNDTTPCMVGVERTQRFLSSLGRYGNTPFLWPMYGTGELPQCFCRLVQKIPLKCSCFSCIHYYFLILGYVLFSVVFIILSEQRIVLLWQIISVKQFCLMGQDLIVIIWFWVLLMLHQNF